MFTLRLEGAERRVSGDALVALGANLGEPARQLARAARLLEEVGELTGKSALYESQPVGGPPGQGAYVNAVVSLLPRAELREPHRLLLALQAIERGMGREPAGERIRWGPRLIDLDLLDYGGELISAPAHHSGGVELPALQLPHPRLTERAFVLAPLADVAPGWRHPVRRLSAEQLLARVDQAGLRRLNTPW